MFIRNSKTEFYDYVKSTKSRLLVYSSYDLDSVCATRILQYLLECDHIQHSIVPIGHREELLTSFREHSDSLKVVLLINLGNCFDLHEFLSPEPNVRIFVCDSRRPIDYYNAYNDEEIQLITCLTGLNTVDDEVKPIPQYEQLFWESDDDNQDMDVNKLSLKQLNKRKDMKRWEQERRHLTFKYNHNSYYSYSSALLMFDLSWKLSKDNNDLLWYAIIGVSDQFITGKINETKYRQQNQYIREAMTRLKNIRGETIALQNSSTNGEQSVVTNNNSLALHYEKDLKLCLYRHWSLYESIRHTLYLSSKFKIWKLRGHKRLLSFLAELGLPLSQCKQKFSSMDLDLRNNVKQWIEDLCAKKQMQQLIDHSFNASRSFKHKYNCNDVAMGARALLESTDRDKRQNQKFFNAIDCLSANNTDLLEKGIDLAKLQLAAVLKQVQIIIDSRQIDLMNDTLWYTVLPETTPDANLFCHAGCLKLLSRYALHALVANSPRNSKVVSKPLIIVTPNPNRPGEAMACAIPPMTVNNGISFFGHAYTQLKEQFEDLRLETDLVDSCIAHLPYTQTNHFLNQLSLLFY